MEGMVRGRETRVKDNYYSIVEQDSRARILLCHLVNVITTSKTLRFYFGR